MTRLGDVQAWAKTIENLTSEREAFKILSDALRDDRDNEKAMREKAEAERDELAAMCEALTSGAAGLIRQYEREACAKVADEIAGNDKDFSRDYRRGAGGVAFSIRSRGGEGR